MAQECDQEITRLEGDMANSNLSEADKAKVEDQLKQARQAGEQGEDQRCLEIVAAAVALVPTAAAAAEGEQANEGSDEGADVTASLKVDQPQPQVTVRQKPPKVTVKIGKPTITVRMPQPEVTVDMPEPNVVVEQQDPDVQVVMAEPDITLANQDQNDGTDRQQATVSVERGQQSPEIQLEQEEPEVTVEQAEPTVNVTSSEQDLSQPMDQTEQMTEQTEQTTERADQARMNIAGMTPDQIIGMNVVNSQNSEVAEIYELVKEANGDRMFAILSVGGFLGLGEKEVAIPLDQFEVRDDGTFVLPQRTEDELESMPNYEPNNYVPVQKAG